MIALASAIHHGPISGVSLSTFSGTIAIGIRKALAQFLEGNMQTQPFAQSLHGLCLVCVVFASHA